MKQIIFVLILFLVWSVLGCSESHEPLDNYTFRVVTIRDMPVDTFAKTMNGHYVLRYIGIDKDYNINKIYVDSIGDLKVTRITEENIAIFELDAKYNPIEFIALYHCEIILDSMKGTYSIGGQSTDTGGEYFIAVKRK
jgi:hypothetical protein